MARPWYRSGFAFCDPGNVQLEFSFLTGSESGADLSRWCGTTGHPGTRGLPVPSASAESFSSSLLYQRGLQVQQAARRKRLCHPLP